MQSLLIIGYVWPEPTATAAGSRMLQIIEQFKLLGYTITFASPAQKPTTAFNLSSINVTAETILLNDVSFDTFIKQLNPNVVLFDRFMMEEQFGWRVAEICPDVIRILDSEDLHFLRKARHEAVKKGCDLPKGIIQSEEAKREIASIYRCDVTLTISDFEMSYLKEVYQIPEKLLWYLPFLVEIDNSLKPTFKERQDFLFIGNFIHAPNWDAVLQLKQALWPAIKKQIPKAQLHIYGGYPTDKVFQLHSVKDRFLVHGRANEVKEVMQQVRVCLAPMRFGAGLKGKLIDAMQNDTPFVTSNIGAEGMFGDLELENGVANNDADFVAKAVRLYSDEKLWKTASHQGKLVLKTRFDKMIFQKEFGGKLNDLNLNLKKYRTENFTGSMLQHHTLKSSMYLSKWIAEKNKS
ncbi:glycosyltransferase [Wenyingzhuangia fucanilytica]|uniref:Glycosyltransferase n=1 Tax=Wenyingzhuangia fucanilytica TaxID=1790137 RepID=A0A1B1Y376_9FLAO|nr:glycosyltransferase family 4 protein [Wenyingzhuangia fucanilytica]ANW95198.1 glycosyltransferase [Wenyingzhuangia fucanilytica]